MGQPKILAFAGSKRNGSFNDKLLGIACRIAEQAGADVTHIQLKDFELPLFCQDVESAGFPENATKLQDLFLSNDALLFACPEYNSSITPIMKNVIDWVSRPNDERAGLSSFAGKTACLISASPGALGGMRGLRHVREILSNINVLVTPGQFALVSAMHAFDENGELVDEKNKVRLSSCIESFVNTASNQLT